MPDLRHDQTVEAFDFAAGRGVICSHGKLFNIQTDSDRREELGCKLRSGVCQKVGQNQVRTAQLCTRKVTAFVEVSVVNIMPLFNFVHWSVKTITC